MTTETIELLCEKLGTTIENLVPKVVERGIYMSKFCFEIALVITLIGIAFGIWEAIERKQDTFAEPTFQTLGCIVFLTFGILAMIISGGSLAKWCKFPEVTAYQTILNWR